MSLNWNIEACKFTEEEKKENWQMIEGFIFLTMSVDMGEITEKNLDEFDFRLRSFHRITHNIDESLLDKLTQFLPRLIGLKTNVITTTRKKFLKKLMDNLELDIEYHIKQRKKNDKLEETKS